jgi:hypothetical protein
MSEAPPDVGSTYPESSFASPGSDDPAVKTGPQASPGTSAAYNLAIRALHDDPTIVDQFGVDDYARALVDFILGKSSQGSLVIGIDAQWGMGKSSLMRMMQWMLDPSNVPESFTAGMPGQPGRPGREMSVASRDERPTVWFNAWKYDAEESLWSALTIEILTVLRKRLSAWQKIDLWWKLRRDGWLTRRYLLDALKPLAYAGIVALVLAVAVGAGWLLSNWDKLSLLPNDPVIQGIIGFVAVLLAAKPFADRAWSATSGAFASGVNQFITKSTFAERVGYLASFEGNFRDIVDVATRDTGGPIVVFVDDLDRCTPTQAVDVIEAISLFLDTSNCVFVLGMDMKTTALYVDVKYRDLKDLAVKSGNVAGSDFGTRFLEKIVQVSFRLPQPSAEDATAFGARIGTDTGIGDRDATRNLEEQDRVRRDFAELAQVGAAIEKCVPYLQGNPRQIKRFVNLFRLHAYIANRRGELHDNEARLIPIARCVLIRLRWPDAIETLFAREEYVEACVAMRNSGQVVKEDPEILAAYLSDPDLVSAHIRFHAIAEFGRFMSEMTDEELEELPGIIRILGVRPPSSSHLPGTRNLADPVPS